MNKPEEGTITTQFDMTVCNDLDRFHLVADVADRVAPLAARAPRIRQAMQEKHSGHKAQITRHGEDMPEVREWVWRGS